MQTNFDLLKNRLPDNSFAKKIVELLVVKKQDSWGQELDIFIQAQIESEASIIIALQTSEED